MSYINRAKIMSICLRVSTYMYVSMVGVELRQIYIYSSERQELLAEIVLLFKIALYSFVLFYVFTLQL